MAFGGCLAARCDRAKFGMKVDRFVIGYPADDGPLHADLNSRPAPRRGRHAFDRLCNVDTPARTSHQPLDGVAAKGFSRDFLIPVNARSKGAFAGYFPKEAFQP